MTIFAAQHIFSTERRQKPVATELLLREHHGQSLDFLLQNPAILKENIHELMRVKAATIRHLLTDYPLHQYFVNVSPEQASSDEFLPSLKTFEAHQVPTTSISLEITERWQFADEDTALANIIKARSMGFSIVVDDFGSAGISLMNLATISPSIVKLDMAMLKSAVVSASHQRLLVSTVRMLHELGAKVVAEGIESAELLYIARHAQCDYVQGFYLDEPAIIALAERTAS